MQRMVAVLLAAIVFHTSLWAQTQRADKQHNIVVTVLNGYNTHNYKAMQRPWVWWTKVIVTKKKLRRGFEGYHTKYGTLSIDTIIRQSRYRYVAKLHTEKQPRTTLYFSYIFKNKKHLEGFGETYPVLAYRKSAVSKIDVAALQADMDTFVLKKYAGSPPRSFNGCIAVLENGNTIYEKCIGKTDVDNGTPLNNTTLFELASVSKQFTAVSILLLESQGKLSLTDTLQRYFPNFPYPNITIEHLLTHTSGLPDYEKLLVKVWDTTKFAANSDVLEQLTIHKPKVLFAPGIQFEYSNTGYVVLASIIEKVSGMAYAQFLRQNIFEPLHMQRTRVYNTRRAGPELLENYAYGYVYDGNNYILPDSLTSYAYVRYQDPITGDGTVNSCINDLEVWEREVLSPKVIPAAILQKAFTNHLLPDGTYTNYGYGFFVSGGGNSERLIYHSGGWPGYSTFLLNIPDQKKQLIILSNNEYGSLSRMADDIATIMIR